MPLQKELNDLGDKQGKNDANQHCFYQCDEHRAPGRLKSARDGSLKNKDGKDCSYGIHYDPFPFHDGGNLSGRFDDPKERSDYGRSGNNQNRSKQSCDPPVPLEDHSCPDAAENKGNGNSQRAEAEDGNSGLLELGEFQGKSSFKKDDGNKKAYDGQEGICFSSEVSIYLRPGGYGKSKSEGE